MKKNKHLLIILTLVFVILSTLVISNNTVKASTYPMDYRYWDQRSSDDADMRNYGCFVTSQAKLLFATGIETSRDFNPDVYLAWQRENGLINSNFCQTNPRYAPCLYATQCNKNLEFLGEWSASSEQLWFNINAGYHTIVKVNGGAHYVYIDNDMSKETGELYIDDTAPGEPRLLSCYAVWTCGYVYKVPNIQPTGVLDLGDSFNAIIKSDDFYNVDKNSNIVLENYSNDLSLVWYFERQSDGSYTIKNVGTQLYLDVYNANDIDGGKITTHTYNGSTAQKYYIYGNESGYILRPQCSSTRVLTVNQGSIAIGHKLNIWQYDDNYDTQLFRIYKLSEEDVYIIANAMKFKDVKTTAWYYDSVKYVYTNNYMNGYNSYTFAPNDNLTRGMIVTVLWKMEESPANNGKSKFADVTSNTWYSQAVKWAVDNKIVSGYKGTNKFGPKDNVTRQDLAVILSNYANYKGKNTNVNANLSKFKDYKNISSYANSAMRWAVGKGVITGNATTKTLNPKGNATRAEAASMLLKYCDKVGR